MFFGLGSGVATFWCNPFTQWAAWLPPQVRFSPRPGVNFVINEVFPKNRGTPYTFSTSEIGTAKTGFWRCQKTVLATQNYRRRTDTASRLTPGQLFANGGDFKRLFGKLGLFPETGAGNYRSWTDIASRSNSVSKNGLGTRQKPVLETTVAGPTLPRAGNRFALK